jgi:hypothetical protein
VRTHDPRAHTIAQGQAAPASHTHSLISQALSLAAASRGARPASPAAAASWPSSAPSLQRMPALLCSARRSSSWSMPAVAVVWPQPTFVVMCCDHSGGTGKQCTAAAAVLWGLQRACVRQRQITAAFEFPIVPNGAARCITQ